MKSRRFAICLFATVICALSGARTAPAASKPNIVYIVSDDARYSDFGFSAAITGVTPYVQTPNLDALAQQSIIGTQFYTSHSICSPSRAGFLSGLYPQRFGYEDNIGHTGAAAGTQGLTADQITVAQRLQTLGYTTGLVGKWHQGYASGVNRPLDKGFDEFYGLLGGGRDYFNQNTADQGIWKNNQFYESQYRTEGDQSRYDPVKGRYVTDAFGEEAASFVNRHANDEEPFFLYMALTGPHDPFQAKKQDLDHFAHLTNPMQRDVAAMTYAVDRAVGDVLGALESNGIDDNTIVIFTNDNGAPSYFENPPFKGHKGTQWEGGIRVPFLIKGPGLEPGIYDKPMTGLDLLPTFVAAGGGDISQFAHDGYDVMPYLTGEAVDDPNKVRIWRQYESYAVRKGDFKLTIPYFPNAPGRALHNIALNPAENVFLSEAQYPLIVADLARELTNWEAGMAKPKWGAIGALDQNTFDHFVFRNSLAATTNWSTASAWTQGGTSSIKTMKPADAYANGIFEFGTRNDADYTAHNDMKRMSRETFMLNQLRLTGAFQGAVGRQGNLTGNAVLFVRNLNGQLPQIRLDATASGTPQNFTFQINNEIQLLHDLEITGNGTQQFVINGRIRDYYEPLQPLVTNPHNVRKTGSSAVILKGNNTFAGTFTVQQGSVTVDGPTAAINGAEGIDIHSAGSVTLQSGTIAVDWIKNAAGGAFQFNGGTLKVINVTGNLVNNGGVYSPGASPALSTVSGNLVQNAGTFLIELGGFGGGLADSVVVGGTATLGSTLDVDFLNGFTPSRGQTFRFLSAAGGIAGTFANTALPTLPGGLTWNLVYNEHVTALVVGGAGGIGSHLPGDYNLDGTVNTADFTVWRNAMLGGNLAADGNSDGIITAADYQIWKAAYGLSLNGSGSFATVPEPSAALLALIGAFIAIGRRKR